jgi:lysophospholipase L1-like esterase
VGASLVLSRVLMIPVAPALIAQGRRLRRDALILPDAAPPWHGTVPGLDPLRLLLIGDSTIAGVGARTQDEALAGQMSTRIAAATGRGVEWVATGITGGKAGEVLALVPRERFDLILLSVGANDALGVRSRRAFRRDLRRLMDALRTASPDAPIIASSMPGFAQFELLTPLVRRHLARHSVSLEQVGRRVVSSYPRAVMVAPAPTYTEGFFAEDLFHPGPSGYRDWADFIVSDPAVATLRS